MSHHLGVPNVSAAACVPGELRPSSPPCPQRLWGATRLLNPSASKAQPPVSPTAQTTFSLPCASGRTDPGPKTKPEQDSQPGIFLLSLSLYFPSIYQHVSSRWEPPLPRPEAVALPLEPSFCLHPGPASPPALGEHPSPDTQLSSKPQRGSHHSFAANSLPLSQHTGPQTHGLPRPLILLLCPGALFSPTCLPCPALSCLALALR